MYQYNYSLPRDNNNNIGRGIGFSGFPTMINSTIMPPPPPSITCMFPTSLVSGNYMANDARIASPAIPNADYGTMPPMLNFHSGANYCGSLLRNNHLPRIRVDPNMNSLINFPGNPSMEWIEERRQQIGDFMTRHPNPTLALPHNNFNSMDPWEVEYSLHNSNAIVINQSPLQALSQRNVSIHGAGVAAENGSYESRKRKREHSLSHFRIVERPAPREGPRIIVRIECQENVPDDGYTWRKYGQKVVKGNSHSPRCYYKCNFSGCNTRKQVERCAYDDRYVICTYDGKHNHPVPPPKGKITTMNEFDEFPKTPERADELNNNNEIFLFPDIMTPTLSNHSESASSNTPLDTAADGPVVSASSAIDAMQKSPCMLDLNLRPSSEHGHSDSTNPEI